MDLSLYDSYKQVVKAWGREVWLCNTPLYCAKLLIVEPGWQCSLHYHPVKHEDFFMIGGSYIIVNGCPGTRALAPGDTVHIPAGHAHRFGVPEGQERAILLEVSTQHSDSDVVRLEDSGPYTRSAA